jgi:hypothetical protein
MSEAEERLDATRKLRSMIEDQVNGQPLIEATGALGQVLAILVASLNDHDRRTFLEAFTKSIEQWIKSGITAAVKH